MTPLERAAKAAYEKFPTVLRGPQALGHLHWEELQEWQKKAFCDARRAALEALMDVTEEMRNAAEYELRSQLGERHNVLAEPIFQAMLREAMK